MTEKQDQTTRRSVLEKAIGGAVTFAGLIWAYRHDQREQEKHGWARADRQQTKIVDVGVARDNASIRRTGPGCPMLRLRTRRSRADHTVQAARRAAGAKLSERRRQRHDGLYGARARRRADCARR